MVDYLKAVLRGSKRRVSHSFKIEDHAFYYKKTCAVCDRDRGRGSDFHASVLKIGIYFRRNFDKT